MISHSNFRDKKDRKIKFILEIKFIDSLFFTHTHARCNEISYVCVYIVFKFNILNRVKHIINCFREAARVQCSANIGYKLTLA